MIWVWIGLALAITLFFLKGKKIQPHNLLWAFLPIDNYGISVAGVMLKPAIIYSIFVIGYSVIAGKFKPKLTLPMIVSSMLLLISIITSFVFRGNDNITSDISAYILFFFSAVVAVCVLSLIQGRDDLRQIKDVLIATSIGYGIVFLVLFALYKAGFSLPAVISTSENEPSVIHLFKNFTGGKLQEYIRLRGFNIDPNSSCISFILGLTFLLSDWIKKGNPVVNTIFALIIMANVVLTSSRSALIVCLMIIAVSIFRLFFSTVQSRKKLIFIGTVLVIVFFIVTFAVYDSKTFSYVYDTIFTGYQNRTGLEEEYGRFSIWREWFSLLNRSNWFYGIGYDNISEAISQNKDAHNTFAQVLCSSGIPVGIVYIIFFLNPLGLLIKKGLRDKQNADFLISFALAYIGLLSILLTISYVASLYLIFFAMLLYISPGCLNRKSIGA